MGLLLEKWEQKFYFHFLSFIMFFLPLFCLPSFQVGRWLYFRHMQWYFYKILIAACGSFFLNINVLLKPLHWNHSFAHINHMVITMKSFNSDTRSYFLLDMTNECTRNTMASMLHFCIHPQIRNLSSFCCNMYRNLPNKRK